jgi:hypothetical protein
MTKIVNPTVRPAHDHQYWGSATWRPLRATANPVITALLFASAIVGPVLSQQSVNLLPNAPTQTRRYGLLRARLLQLITGLS